MRSPPQKPVCKTYAMMIQVVVALFISGLAVVKPGGSGRQMYRLLRYTSCATRTALGQSAVFLRRRGWTVVHPRPSSSRGDIFPAGATFGVRLVGRRPPRLCRARRRRPLQPREKYFSSIQQPTASTTKCLYRRTPFLVDVIRNSNWH